MKNSKPTTKINIECCICKKEILPDFNGWGLGHNAEPIKEGRCCSNCNFSIVIPERIKNIQINERGLKWKKTNN